MKPIVATAQMKTLLSDHYRDLARASQQGDQKVAWCSSVGPAEVLLAAGYHVYFPENHTAMIGAKRLSTRYIDRANAHGYSPEICAYLTTDIGAHLMGETPFKDAFGMEAPPRPDVLVYNTNQCRELQDWFAFYGREFDVPVLGIHSPWKIEDVTREAVTYVADQFRDLGEKLAHERGESFDMERFKGILRFSQEATELWKQFLNLAQAKPSPITFFDATIQMAPIVVTRGLPQTVDYYKLLVEEIGRRVKEGVGAVDNEVCRFYWEGMPIWGRLRFLSELFERLGASVVASTYCNSWVFDSLDLDRPFEGLAKSHLEIFINRAETVKETMVVDIAKEFRADAILFHDARTCPYNSNNRFGMPERLRERWGYPVLNIFGDMSDLRCFSEEQTVTLMETFMERRGGTHE